MSARSRRSPRRRASSTPPGSQRGTLYSEVTARIIAEMEAGRVPWVQPWDAAAATGLPRNALSGRAYSGINILLLWGAFWRHATPERIQRGYPSQGWLTFRQALEAGGAVRKGEQGVTVVYADRFAPEAEKARARDSGEDAKVIPFLKRFTVFNVAQCDGLPEHMVTAAPALPERETIPVAEALISESGADFRIGGNRAFYAPADDFVQVPPQPAFRDQINYYRTALHELTHWTGHASRLARDQSGAFGSQAYAREELCAEMGSAFLCAALGIQPTVRHADDRAIFRAASQASKAADYLLARRDPAPAMACAA
jgi:antirestriction protein ArdC